MSRVSGWVTCADSTATMAVAPSTRKSNPTPRLETASHSALPVMTEAGITTTTEAGCAPRRSMTGTAAPYSSRPSSPR